MSTPTASTPQNSLFGMLFAAIDPVINQTKDQYSPADVSYTLCALASVVILNSIQNPVEAKRVFMEYCENSFNKVAEDIHPSGPGEN